MSATAHLDETQKLLYLTRAERQSEGLLHQEAQRERHKLEGDTFQEVYTFANFTIETHTQGLGNPVSEFRIGTGDNSIDVLERFVPKQFGVKVTHYPFGATAEDMIETPKPMTRAKVLSFFHEVTHAQRKAQYTEVQKEEMLAAYRALRAGKATPAQKTMVENEENQCWVGAIDIAQKIDSEIGSDILKNIDITELNQFISTRQETYKK